jgi:hypothetical protein
MYITMDISTINFIIGKYNNITAYNKKNIDTNFVVNSNDISYHYCKNFLIKYKDNIKKTNNIIIFTVKKDDYKKQKLELLYDNHGKKIQEKKYVSCAMVQDYCFCHNEMSFSIYYENIQTVNNVNINDTNINIEIIKQFVFHIDQWIIFLDVKYLTSYSNILHIKEKAKEMFKCTDNNDNLYMFHNSHNINMYNTIDTLPNSKIYNLKIMYKKENLFVNDITNIINLISGNKNISDSTNNYYEIINEINKDLGLKCFNLNSEKILCKGNISKLIFENATISKSFSHHKKVIVKIDNYDCYIISDILIYIKNSIKFNKCIFLAFQNDNEYIVYDVLLFNNKKIKNSIDCLEDVKNIFKSFVLKVSVQKYVRIKSKDNLELIKEKIGSMYRFCDGLMIRSNESVYFWQSNYYYHFFAKKINDVNIPERKGYTVYYLFMKIDKNIYEKNKIKKSDHIQINDYRLIDSFLTHAQSKLCKKTYIYYHNDNDKNINDSIVKLQFMGFNGNFINWKYISHHKKDDNQLTLVQQPINYFDMNILLSDDISHLTTDELYTFDNIKYNPILNMRIIRAIIQKYLLATTKKEIILDLSFSNDELTNLYQSHNDKIIILNTHNTSICSKSIYNSINNHNIKFILSNNISDLENDIKMYNIEYKIKYIICYEFCIIGKDIQKFITFVKKMLAPNGKLILIQINNNIHEVNGKKIKYYDNNNKILIDGFATYIIDIDQICSYFNICDNKLIENKYRLVTLSIK